jgi:hypothetical protein
MCRSAGPRRARCDETPIEMRELRHDDANGIARQNAQHVSR